MVFLFVFLQKHTPCLLLLHPKKIQCRLRKQTRNNLKLKTKLRKVMKMKRRKKRRKKKRVLVFSTD